MKAIHNENCIYTLFHFTVFNISKIQNESNSQPYLKTGKALAHCFQYFKDTK